MGGTTPADSADHAGDLLGRRAVAAARELRVHRALGQPTLGVDRRRTSRTGGGDRLTVRVVDEVTAGEHAGNAGSGGRSEHGDVPGVVRLDLAADQPAARL